MEVSNVRDHVTHATISGNKAINFGISDDPEFFHILSSTLYSDQPLAVVRETVCNAWDAHIESGRANKPIEITLTDEELIIRDFGHGISDDDIGPIYGVYGGSTKKKNKLVTGGFGLGCKSPFAYTDHFEVTSWHAGRKTIYNMSKSSAEVNGRPGIIPIASFPSDETGLQVRIQLNNVHDRHRFAQIIRRIVSNGEISATLNGNPIDVLPFSSMKHDFMVTSLRVIEGAHRILVRYGHVIYPVEEHEDFAPEYWEIERFLAGQLPNEGFQIIFQAKPDSISVTPSRESLSMQQHTVNTLTEIFQNFVTNIYSRVEDETYKVLEESIVDRWVSMRPGELFDTSCAIPGLSRRDWGVKIGETDRTILVEPRHLAAAKSCWNYPDYRDFRFKDLLSRVDSMIQANFGNVGLIKSYRSELIRERRRKSFGRDSTWFHRKVLGPLMRDLNAVGLKGDRLSVYGKSGHRDHFKWNETYFTKATKYATRALDSQLPFLRNIVVLSHNQQDVENRVYDFPVMKNWLGKASSFLVYAVPRSLNEKKIQAIRDFFASRGVVLIDLTIYHSWETKPVAIAKKVEDKPKPRPKGLPILGSLLNGGIRVDFLGKYTDEERDIKRTMTPKVLVQVPRKQDRIHTLERFSRSATEAICALWPNDIALATNTAQFIKFSTEGVTTLNTWVVEKVCAEIETNKRIHEARAFDFRNLRGLSGYGEAYHMLQLIWDIPELRAHFGIVNNLTETDRHYLTLWEELTKQWSHWVNLAEVKKAKAVIDAIKPDAAVTKLHKVVETNQATLNLLQYYSVRHNLLFKDSPKKKPIYDKTMELVLLVLKG